MTAFNKKNVILNNGSEFHIATYQYGTPTFGTSIAKGTNHPPTVLDISRDIILLMKPIVIDYYVNTLRNAVTLEVFNSDSYQNDKTYFNNNVRWLWGSVDSGGVYLRKTAEGKACFGGITCLARNEATQTYRYIINESDSFSTTELYDVVFMYDEDSTNEDYPMMYVFTLADMRVWGTSPQGFVQTYYDKYIYNALTNLYTESPCERIDEMTQYITWEGVTGNKPSCYVKGNEGLTFPHNLEYLIAGLPEYFTDTIVSGDPWGGQLADNEDDPEDNAGTSEESGDAGQYPSSTGHIDNPNSEDMAVDITNSGFITIYNPTQAQVKSFANWLFTDITDSVSTQLKRLWANPLDFTLFLALAHFTPVSKVDDTISYAGIDTGIIAHKCKQFKHLDMGSIELEGDTKKFLDYQPYTKISIYLPYIGIREMNPDELVGSKIELYYDIDCASGACIATIKCIRSLRRSEGDAELDDVVYHFDGNCFEQIPLTATDWRGMITSMFNVIGGVASIGGGIAGGNAGAIGGGITQVVDGVTSQKVNVSRTGQLSGASGYMDTQKPYLIIERPIEDNPYNYKGFKGKVLNMRYNLGQLNGYTEIESDTLWLNGFDGITDEEAQMLKDITANGFYL